MGRRRMTGVLAAAVLLAGVQVLQSGARTAWLIAGQSQPSPEIRIWREFVALMKSGTFKQDRIRPIPEMAGQEAVLMGFLDQMRKQAHWQEWDRQPEIQRNGAVVNFILPLTFGQEPPTDYCFMFLDEGGTWSFHHLEAIFIRLDRTPQAPTSRFPDTTDYQKAWDREERCWSQIVQWRSTLLKEKDKAFFLDLLKDGNGYFVWAKTRVPFVAPHRAFILFLCWEQANLRGLNTRERGLVLEKLTDNEAVVRLAPFYFMLYQAAAHLKPAISFADYKEMFETIWQDRARAAGWMLAIEYAKPDATECVFHFTRRSPDS